MPTWNELFSQEQHRWQDPHHTVVSFGAALTEQRAERVLDLGCGAGRHVVHLTRLGFQVVGADISEKGLSVTQQRLAGCDLLANLQLCDVTAIPLADGSVDAVVTLYVIYHNRLEGIQRTVQEIERVLRPGGLLLITLMSQRSHRYGDGEEIEPDTFLPTTGADAGVPHHFFGLAGVLSLMEPFRVSSLYLDEREEHTEDGRTQLHSHWVCVAHKAA